MTTADLNKMSQYPRNQPGVYSTNTFVPDRHAIERWRIHRKEKRSISYELLVCGLSGHRLVGGDVDVITTEEKIILRDFDDMRWHRCLRCDAWLPRPLPVKPSFPFLPSRSQINIPLRGKLLRDKYILRLIAINKFFHFLLGALLTVMIIYYAFNRDELHDKLINLLNSFRLLLGENIAIEPKKGFMAILFQGINAKTSWVLAFAVGLGIYSTVAAGEMIGLWYARRWAEYLTLTSTSVFLIPEIFELTESITAIKVFALIINLIIIVYLLFVKRLFGIRGGVHAEQEEKSLDVGWSALERVYP